MWRKISVLSLNWQRSLTPRQVVLYFKDIYFIYSQVIIINLMPEKFLLSQKISRELKKQRLFHGISQEKMALKCNVDRKYLYIMEKGKTKH